MRDVVRDLPKEALLLAFLTAIIYFSEQGGGRGGGVATFYSIDHRAEYVVS